MIELIHITKYIGKRKILDDISLSLPAQGIVLLRGENGSGKTTLFTLLALLDKDFSGDYRIDGKSSTEFTSKEISDIRAQDISYIRQKDNFLSFLNLDENEHLDDFLQKKKTSLKRSKQVACTSEGEAILSVLRREMIPGKKIYLLDEVMDHLDEKNRLRLLDEIKERAKTSLVLIIGHDLPEDIGEVMTITLDKGKVISVANEKKTEESKDSLRPGKTRCARFSGLLFLKSFRKRGFLSLLFFFLFSFAGGCSAFPTEAISYDYGDMLIKDAEIGTALKTYTDPEQWTKKYSYQSSGCLILSSDIPDDGFVHLPPKTKTNGAFATNGLALSIPYAFDDGLPFSGCFINTKSYEKAVQGASPDLLSLLSPVPYVVNDATNDFFSFGNKAVLEQTYGLQLDWNLQSGIFYVFGQGNDATISFPSKESLGLKTIDFSTVFSSAVPLIGLTKDEYSSRETIPSATVLVSDEDFRKLTAASFLPNSLIFFMDDKENQHAYCHAIAEEKLIPVFYGMGNGASDSKFLKTNYANMLINAQAEKNQAILIYVFVLVFSLFLTAIYSFLDQIQNQKDDLILYQKGYTKKQVLFYPLGHLLLLETISAVVGYPFGMVLWGAMESNLFGYFPTITVFSFLLALLLVVVDALLFVICFLWQKKKLY
jgi:putative ABC transport system ATP-binding protein